MKRSLIAPAVAFLKRVAGKTVSAVGGRIANEPVLIMTFAAIGLSAYQSAQSGGLTPGDAVVAGVEAVLGFFARQLVWPAVKVSVDGELAETVSAPYIPGEDDDA